MLRPLLAGLVLLAAGCGGEASVGDTPPATLDDQVRLVREGGVGGRRVVVIVAPSGRAVRATADGGDVPDEQLSKAQIGDLASDLDGWADQDTDQRSDGTASDLFVYRIAYDGHEVTTDEDADPDDQVTDVLERLEPLLPKG